MAKTYFSSEAVGFKEIAFTHFPKMKTRYNDVFLPLPSLPGDWFRHFNTSPNVPIFRFVDSEKKAKDIRHYTHSVYWKVCANLFTSWLSCRSFSYHFSSISSNFKKTDAILLVPKEGCSQVPFSKRQITNWYNSRESVCDLISEESLLSKLSMSALAVLTFVIKDKKSGVWDLQRLCLLHRVCQTLGQIHVECIATDTWKLKEPVHWEYTISAFCSLLALKAKQVRVFWSSLLCSAATAVVRYLHLQGAVAKFLAQIWRQDGRKCFLQLHFHFFKMRSAHRKEGCSTVQCAPLFHPIPSHPIPSHPIPGWLFDPVLH